MKLSIKVMGNTHPGRGDVVGPCTYESDSIRVRRVFKVTFSEQKGPNRLRKNIYAFSAMGDKNYLIIMQDDVRYVFVPRWIDPDSCIGLACRLNTKMRGALCKIEDKEDICS